MELVYADDAIVVCVKPSGVVSTDEPGGVPALVREALGDPKADVRTVHRLDQVVSGLMVLARSEQAASELSRQIRENEFEKEYLAVIHGKPAHTSGRLVDLLYRDKARRMTMVADAPGKGVQEAVLTYKVVESRQEMSKVAIQLLTGRTHQIRVQFASRGNPLVGERKYSTLETQGPIALWSHRLSMKHPTSGERIEFILPAPGIYPWDIF